jgi:tripartite-type tricarboxylate transporter receptor subunit TctC
MVVPFPAGGPTDTVGRIVAERMRVSLGQPIIIENVTGGGGTIGVGRVARAVPDGYTLSVGYLGTHVLNGAIYPLQYDVLNDFEPVALLASNPQLIVAKNATPAKSLNELIAWLKANPGKASQGTAGVGNPAHVSGAYFQRETGTLLSIRALSRCRSGNAGFDRWPDRRHGRCPLSVGARNPERGRGRTSKILHFYLVRHVGAQRHIQGCRR